MKKLKILLLSDDFYPVYGGVSTIVEKTARALSKFADVTIGTAQIPENSNYVDDENAPFSIIRCRAKYSPITTNMNVFVSKDAKFKKAIEGEKFDVIHCHFPLKLFQFALKVGKKTKTPVILTAHSQHCHNFKDVLKFDFLTNIAMKFIMSQYAKADKVWYVTNFCKKEMDAFRKLENGVVVQNAISEPDVIENRLESIDDFLHVEKTDFVIASIGRLIKSKNNVFAIKSLPKIVEKHPNVKLVIIGDGEQEKSLKNLVEKLCLQKNVVFMGAIKNRNILNQVFERINLVSFVSYGDSCGLIQLEAAFFEKATIGLENSAITEQMQHLKNGFIVENMNENEFFEVVDFCINNPQKLAEIGKNAKKTIFRSYADEKIAKNLFEEYQKVINDFAQK